MTNEEVIMQYVKHFYDLIRMREFVEDKNGGKIVEIICPNILLDPRFEVIDLGVKKTNVAYCTKELLWYLSQDRCINGYFDDIKIWNNVCDKDKYVNSNYGWCIFSKENNIQYDNCIKELKNNSSSRRAVMVYNRPSMWDDYNKNGMNDFICTDGVQCFIRDKKLVYIVKQRSCDFVYGFFNDFFWHCYVYNRMLNDLKNVEVGNILYIPFSFHVYQRHFDLIKKIIE